MTVTDWIQALGSVGALVVALFAVWVAWAAKRVADASNVIASDARDAETAQAAIADEALRATRRQTDLTAVPHLIARNPRLHPGRGADRPDRFGVDIENGGPTVAYGIILSAALASERDLDSVDESTRGASRREPGLAPGQRLETLAVPMPTGTSEWLAVRVAYHTPLGTSVRQDYLWGRTTLKWRLHRITISPEAGPPLQFELSLELDLDEPDRPPFGAVS